MIVRVVDVRQYYIHGYDNGEVRIARWETSVFFFVKNRNVSPKLLTFGDT